MRLIPDQVSDNWEFFAPTIYKSLPPTMKVGSDTMTNILEAILLEELTVWVLVEDSNQSNYIAILTTQLNYERISQTRNLLIYTFTAFGNLSYDYWKEILEVLYKHADANSCASIMAYSQDDKIKKFLQGESADVSNTLIKFEV